MKSNLYLFLIVFVFGICPNAKALNYVAPEEHEVSFSSVTESNDDVFIENGRKGKHSKLERTFTRTNVIPNTSRSSGPDFFYDVQISSLFLFKNYLFKTNSCYETKTTPSILPLFKQFNNYRL